MYTPEVWKDKDKGKRRGGADARAQTRAGTAPVRQLSHRIKTVAQAQRHVARLEEELEAARLKLRHLEKRRDGDGEEEGGKDNGRVHRQGQEKEPDDEDQYEDDDDDDDNDDDHEQHPSEKIATRGLPNTLDKSASPRISTEGSSGDLKWSLEAIAPVRDQILSNIPGPSSVAVVAKHKQQAAEDNRGRQGAGTNKDNNEHENEDRNENENKNKKVNARRHWIKKGGKAAALAKAFFGPGPDSDSDSDFETGRKLDKLSTYLSDRYGGSHV